ncbi:MAG: 2OG-Fe(II) oxygenase [Pelagibacteraceae bacterium]|jgi:Rps23 Pro-64 3,4-dihydroxylase Tpa1-like proline 4-hydroxylase|nr:2OG-Fe(II) oxygenase [Pelagibacteraceae bacterium]|tara:strand:+ start:988 stop:1776 length:789 start_codon:yes stop_codon:yes gene_type:complete
MKIISSEKKIKKQLKNINKKPFHHVVIDNFLNKKFINKIYKEFPNYSDSVWHEYNNYCENKKTTNIWNLFKPNTYKLFTFLNSQEFIDLIQKYLTKKKIFSDDGLHGSGLSVMKSSVGRLNPHLDNSIHPKNELLRKYNLILFLNKNWKKNMGGNLMLYERNKFNRNIHGNLSKSIAPYFNRCVIFDNYMNSWHSVQKIKKQKNLFRKSIQIYYFVNEKNIRRKRLKVFYAPEDIQRKNKKVLDFIKKRSNNRTFQTVYKTK